MPQNVIYRRWIYDETACRNEVQRGFYYLVPLHGRRVAAVAAFYEADGELAYKVLKSFKRNHRDIVDPRTSMTWSRYEDLVIWLNAQIHNSFLRHSVVGPGSCWFHKQLWGSDLHSHMVLPVGLWPYIQCIGRAVWILFRHGSKAWPIQVINGRFEKGWSYFRKAHNLEPGTKLILGCERKWIFDVTIFDADDKEVLQPWSSCRNSCWEKLPTPADSVSTSCVPSTVYNDCQLVLTGFQSQSSTNYLQEFQRIINPLLIEFAEDFLVITMCARVWIIRLQDRMCLDVASFNEFLAAIAPQPSDYIFVAVLAGFRIKVVVFDRITKCEKLYDWFDEEE